ncbi:hypothetical protein [uncultured Sphingomonas sp.]|uniref:hypothetical protein n=1 Tax=uncultured Sphingomonas sp. TaxID=158754 RepID=UPI00258A0EF2|nr:hypothetical protein [uncultured Sphingomonas sp.]
MILATLLATAAPVVVPLDAACVVGTDPAAQVLRERLVERGAMCRPHPTTSPQRRLGSPAAPAAPDTMDSGLRRNDGVSGQATLHPYPRAGGGPEPHKPNGCDPDPGSPPSRGYGCGRAPVAIRFLPAKLAPEAFAITTTRTAITIRAATTRARLFAAGYLLRHLDNLTLTAPAHVAEAPAMAIRGTQIGYRAKNNSYDAWTVPMLTRRIEDFALLGGNRIQFVAPVSDDAASSPLSPLPATETLIAVAQATHRLGIDVGLFYPLLRDYGKPGSADAEVADFTALAAKLPALDALYIPGGDPGHTAPDRLFPVAARVATALRRRFAKAEVLLSTQGFDAAGLDAFHAQLAKRPRWLTAIFVGPQTRDSIADHRRRIAGRYPIETYPDTAHTMHAQFPIPDWHPAFALTEGREPVNPRPAATTRIFAYLAPATRGFVTYSEGVNDDWNVTQWFRLGWNPATPAAEIAGEYARMFVGDRAFAAVPQALEGNWRGDPSANAGIDATLALVNRLHPARWADWRIDLYRYRATYDALVRHRLIAAKAAQAEALYTLRQAPATGAQAAAVAARFAYARPEPAMVAPLRTDLTAIADRLWDRARMQLSVPRHGASNWERGANLDRADIQLNDRTAVESDIADALTRPDAAARLAMIGDPWRTRDMALYDDLGDPTAEPHLVRGPGFDADPQSLVSAIDGVADHYPDQGWRMADLSYAEGLYETPVRLRYTGLERNRRYRLVARWAGEDYALPMRLTGNGVELHGPRPRKGDRETVETAIPQALTADGTLTLEWHRPPGIGGGGRGHQIAQTWLIPEPLVPEPTAPGASQ